MSTCSLFHGLNINYLNLHYPYFTLGGETNDPSKRTLLKETQTTQTTLSCASMCASCEQSCLSIWILSCMWLCLCMPTSYTAHTWAINPLLTAAEVTIHVWLCVPSGIQTWDLQNRLCLNIVDALAHSATTAGWF